MKINVTQIQIHKTDTHKQQQQQQPQQQQQRYKAIRDMKFIRFTLFTDDSVHPDNVDILVFNLPGYL